MARKRKQEPDQTYLQTSEWRRGEEESLRNLTAGIAQTFDDNPAEAIRWLEGEEQDGTEA